MRLALALTAALFALGALLIAVRAGRASRSGAARELWHAYFGTITIVAAVLVPAAIHPALFAAVAAVAAYRCALELAAILRHRPGPAARCAIVAAIVVGVLLGSTAQDTHASSVLMGCTAAVLLLSAPLYARAVTRPPPHPLAWLTAAAFPLAAAAQLAHLAHRSDGFLWIFLLYATVEVQDSMAFLFGRLFGRRALMPKLSPRKTVEGALAGAFFGLGVGTAIAVLLLDQSPGLALALAALVTASGFAGDLFASALKRAAGVKDFPAVSALHGGVMDIYDSTLFAALPLGAILWLATI